uniref:Reverse transcriptase domain-containing protein n=1 Tax=Tanacetum cinerariifolium TaxID=118510 RepID=A0A6L2KBF5_TANCI|nr:hypothetical protein [Tanacetum cinerariifolium]
MLSIVRLRSATVGTTTIPMAAAISAGQDTGSYMLPWEQHGTIPMAATTIEMWLPDQDTEVRSSVGKTCLGENVIEISSDKVKLCLEHEVKRRNKVVKKELIIALRGEIYFVKFIINPEEDDVEPQMGKSSRNKRKQLEKYQLIYSDMGPSMSIGTPLTQEEAEREALAINIYVRYSLLEEERPVIETLAYSDKYKKILDGICLDKMKLDRMNKEGEESIIKIKGEAISMLDHSKAEPMGLLSNVLCQVGVTTIIAKFLILPIDRDTPILVGRGFLHTCGRILNTIDNITSTFDGICHQKFRAAKTSLDIAKSDSNDEEEYAFQRNKFGAPIYGPKFAGYLNCNDPLDQSLTLQEVLNPFRKICVWKKVVSFLGSLPVALQHFKWKPDYTRCFNKKEDSDGQLWEETMMKLYIPRVTIPGAQRASMQDLYERMGSMEIRQGAIERMAYRQSYHWDSMTSIISSTYHSSSRSRMMSSVEMTQVIITPEEDIQAKGGGEEVLLVVISVKLVFGSRKFLE